MKEQLAALMQQGLAVQPAVEAAVQLAEGPAVQPAVEAAVDTAAIEPDVDVDEPDNVVGGAVEAAVEADVDTAPIEPAVDEEEPENGQARAGRTGQMYNEAEAALWSCGTDLQGHHIFTRIADSWIQEQRSYCVKPSPVHGLGLFAMTAIEDDLQDRRPQIGRVCWLACPSLCHNVGTPCPCRSSHHSVCMATVLRAHHL